MNRPLLPLLFISCITISLVRQALNNPWHGIVLFYLHFVGKTLTMLRHNSGFSASFRQKNNFAHTIFYLVLGTLASSCSKSLVPIKVMSYNIRLDNKGDNEDNWKHRKEAMVAFIDSVGPDVFGIQEGLSHQVAYLDSALSNYESIGVGRDDGIEAGEHMSIFYNPKKISLLGWQTMWLSPTPKQVSMGWDAACYRTCTIGNFKKGNQTFTLLNTHFDHAGAKAREESSHLISSFFKSQDHPAILIGDFNLEPSSPLYAILTESMQDAGYNNSSGTFNGFKEDKNATRRIDYLFYNEEKWTAFSYQVLKPKVSGRQVSDHYPVLASFKAQ